MVALPEEPLHMTEAEYLEFEENSPEKHEFVNGDVRAMTGASFRHNIICANALTTLNIQLAERDCLVSTSDTRVKIASKSNASRVSYRYPDVMVVCGAPQYVSNRTDTISNPVVLVEVLSPATALVDRNEKLDEYIRLESLQAYVMIAQDEAKIERYLRQTSGDWLYTRVSGLDAQIDLPPIECTLTLSDVYRKITFEDDPE